MKLALVIDTNVIVSAFLKRGSPPSMLLGAGYAGRFEYVTTPAIAAEYEDVLSRPFLGLTASEVREFVGFACSQIIVVHPRPLPFTLPDPDDMAFCEAATVATLKTIVTGNRKHYLPALAAGFNVISPADALREFF